MCSATVGCAWAASTAGRARQISRDAALRIERKRDGGTLTPEEWSALVAAYTADRIPDYQMSALLMAVLLRGLERQELAALTDAMLASGQRLAFDSWGTP